MVEGEPQERLAPLRGLKGKLPENLASVRPDRTRTFVFSLREKGENYARINGQYFQTGKTNVQVKLGSVERWILKNPRKDAKTTHSEHPFHIHVNDFQVVRVNGKKYRAKGQQDIVTIPVGGEVVIKQRFADFPGKSVFHCHIVAHEDGGMMQSFRIVR